MNDNVETPMLEHLRHIRGRVDRIAEDPGTMQLRRSSLESQVAGLHADNMIAHRRMDRMDARLERIERRLDLREPA